MINIKKPVVLGVAASLALGIFGAVPAHAEPVTNSFAIVGSDTLQDVINGLVNGTGISGAGVRSLASGKTAGSYDATGSVLVQTKSAGVRFGRPNGSGDGVKALSRSIDGANYKSATVGSPTLSITGQVDIARSSSGNTVDAAGALKYIPFGRDALSYAHTGSVAAFDNIDAATLKGLFECTITQVGGVTVVPVIPQAGSGTRKDFIGKIGVTETSMLEVSEGGCVVVGQEHDTATLADLVTPFPANGVTAMSAAQWVAQNTGAGIDRRGATAKLGSPLVGVSPVTGTGTSMAPNPTYYANTTWGRDTYIVVENARVTVGDPKYDAALADLVSTGGAKLGNTSSTLPSQAGSVKKKYGFLAPASLVPFRAALTA